MDQISPVETGRASFDSRRRVARSRRRGLSLVEILFASSIFAVAAGATTYTLIKTTFLSRSTRETSRALEAAEGILETLKSEEFDKVFARFNATNADDSGTSPGSDFAVPELDARAADADGLAGRILFPGDGVTLQETVVDRGLGMPRDLNGDGDALDAGTTYTVLPVRVRVEWRGSTGDRFIELCTTLTND
jgi:prepilin-type N-terminal cleavage/methylation domain-containing protein